MRKTFRAMVLGAALAVGLTGIAAGPAPATGTDDGLLAPSAEAHIRSELTRYGVTGSVQDDLVEKAREGILWDNMSGVAPIETSTSQSGAMQETVERYPDGSISVTSLEVPSEAPAGQIGTMKVSQCKLTSSSSHHATWTDCLVSRNDVVARAGFRIGYTKYNGTTQAPQISGNPSGWAITYYMGTPNSVTLPRVIQRTASSTPARARADWMVSATSPVGGGYSAHLEFKLSRSGAVSSGYRL